MRRSERIGPLPLPSPSGSGRLTDRLSLRKRVRARAQDPVPAPSRRPIDWRGWIVLAWVIWFGLLYGKMVVEQARGQDPGSARELREGVALRLLTA